GFREPPRTVTDLQIVDYEGEASELLRLKEALAGLDPPAPVERSPESPPRPASDSSLGLVIGAIAAAVVVAVALVLTVVKPWDRGGETFPVDGSKIWTDTGRDLRAGDRVTIAATGTVLHNTADPLSATGPGGDPRPELFQFDVVPGTNHAALIARVAEGRPFIVGGGSAFTAASAGR